MAPFCFRNNFLCRIAGDCHISFLVILTMKPFTRKQIFASIDLNSPTAKQKSIFLGAVPNPYFREGIEGREVMEGDPLTAVFLNKSAPDPNLCHKLDNTGSTQTNTIFSMSPILDDIDNHVTATCVSHWFPDLLPKPNDAKSTPHSLHYPHKTHTQTITITPL